MRRELNRSSEEMARREKISEMLQALYISSLVDIKELYRQTIARFMENSLGSELNESQGYERYDQAKKDTENSRNDYSKKTLKTSFGDEEIAMPQDRKSEFNPQILIENFFGLLKNELFYFQDPSSMKHSSEKLREYLDYYNNQRIKLKQKGLTPALRRPQALLVD